MPLQVPPGGQPAGEGDGARVALPRGEVQAGASGVGQAEHPGDLVVGLPRGVVEGGPDRGDPAGDVLHQQQVGVAAAHQQRHRRLRQRPVVEDVDRDVGHQVVHAVDRHPEPQGQRLGRAHPDQERPGQARARGHGHRVHLGQPDAGLRAGPLDRRDHRLQVRPARDLRHHPAESDVLLDAAGHRRADQLLAPDEPDARLVAAALDPQHQGSAHVVSSLLMIRASTGGAPSRRR